MEENSKRDTDALPGERWFPSLTRFEDEMSDNWGDFGSASEVDDLKAVLLRRPGKEVENFDWHAARFLSAVDPEKMRAQHDTMAQIYRDNGVKVFYVNEQREDRPNALFMRDLVLMTPEGAIVTRPAIAARRGEEKYAAKALAELGCPILRTIAGDAVFDGAMVLWIDRRTVILASGVRCNKAGYDMVEWELKRMGVDSILHMQIPYGHAHIDGLINMASHDTALMHASQVPYDICDALKKKGIKLLEAPSQREAKETLGINFVAIRPGYVLMPEGNPRCQELLEDNGIKTITVDISEILKGVGAIHCMTAFLKRG